MVSTRKLIGEILRAAARLTAARNALLTGFGMTSARLRLLKTIRGLPIPFTVSELARAMNVRRQTVQPVVHELEAEGLVRLEQNSRHRRAPLVVLTSLGQTTLEQLTQVENRWVADLARGFDSSVLEQTEWLLRIVRDRAGAD